MSFTLNDGKELAVAPRPVCFCDFTFPDGATLYVASIAATFNGHDYEARIDDQQMDRIAALSEQGVDRVPSVTLVIADPSASVFQAYERGHGFKGAQLTLRLALYDMQAGTFSTDNFVPFVGQCDQPSTDDKSLTVTAVSILNLSRFMLPTVPIQARCPWINPATSDQRALASDANSPYFLCGETRDLSTAPPCQYSKQTCTQHARYGGVTWMPGKQSDTGINYLSGGKWSWVNADTSGKYKEFWPAWLGGKAWVQCIAITQWGDGNYTRGDIAVGFGAVNIERVIVNGVEVSQGGKDYFWGYSNNGARDGTINNDSQPSSPWPIGDPYGNCTVIEIRVPKAVLSPESPATVQVLGEKLLGGAPSSMSSIAITSSHASQGPIVLEFGRVLGSGDPGDGSPITITGSSWAGGDGGSGNPVNGSFVMELLETPYDHATLKGTWSNGSGGAATLYYNKANQSGGAPTPSVIAEALKWCGIPTSGLNATDFTSASSIANASISYTDGDGNSQTQPRFASAIAIRQRRSVAEIVRGLRQSVGAYIGIDSAGLVTIRMEGPLAEQQASEPDGSNDSTGITSLSRSGATPTGYFAYKFNESNSTGLKRSGQPVAQSPNRVTFSFQDPAQGYAISTFSIVEPDDVARIGYEVPGGLQVNPEGIASYNFANRCGKLGLAKIHRGNPEGDTRGTDWFEWQTSFRACKLRIGDIVSIDSAKYSLTDYPVRITEIRPDKNFEKVTLKGHAHNDDWYLDSHGDTPDAAYGGVPNGGTGVTVPPTFAVESSAIDPTVAEVTGLAFSDSRNTYSITAGTWTFYFVDAASPLTTLAADLAAADTSMTVTDASDIAEGDLIQTTKEIVLCGAPSGGVVPITRLQLGSIAEATVASGASIWKVRIKSQTVAFPLDFVNSPDINTWVLLQPLPEMRLVSVGGSVTNAFGESPIGRVTLTDNVDFGLILSAAGGPGAAGLTVYNKTNEDFMIPAGNVFVSVVATTRDCTLTLPTESSDLVSGVASIVIVKRALGSTHDVIVVPNSGPSDTIESSSSGRHLTATGETREYIPN